MSRIALRNQSDGQPSFLLRAVDPETGQLVWSDRFSTAASGVRAERISRNIVGMEPLAPQDVEFRIQMFDATGRRLLWEDKIMPVVEGTGASSELREEEAGAIPLWWLGPEDLSIREMI